jgi:hypothetical protein
MVKILYILLIITLFVGCSSLEKQSDLPGIEQHKLGISNLNDLPQDFHIDVSENENAYIIVHPSYYIFMDEKPFDVDPDESKNAVESFIENKEISGSSYISFMKAYERNEMNFIINAGRQKKLVILILPGMYLKSDHYVYKNSSIGDQFARYLNHVTHGSYTIFYLETIKTTSGEISSEDAVILVNFLRKQGVKNIYIGGGYVGRCQEEFYKMLILKWPQEYIALVPEITAISPDDIKESTSQLLLTTKMQINEWAVDYLIKNKLIDTLETTPNTKTLSDISDHEQNTAQTSEHIIQK